MRWSRFSRNHLKYHCNPRGISYVFELLDIGPDVIALVLILSWHHQCKARVYVRHSECPRLFVNLWGEGEETLSSIWGVTCKQMELAHSKDSLSVVKWPCIEKSGFVSTSSLFDHFDNIPDNIVV